MNTLNVLYSTDSNYAPHAAASIYSLLNNNKDFEKINIYMIDDSLSEECKLKFNQMIDEFCNATIIFYPFDKLKPKLQIKDSWFAMVGYARLMLSEFIDAEKVLYIDCDTIVNGSVKDLWGTELEDNYIGGVQDNPALYALEAIGMDANDRYINSGVMLINLNKWKADNIEDKIVQMIKKHNGFVLHHDQGMVNGVCRGHIKILHPKFNTMSQMFLMKAKQIKSLYDINEYYTQTELDEATRNPVIIHYINKFYNRPWFRSCSHPLKDLYVENLSKTPFNYELKEGSQKNSVKIRKFIFDHFPYFVYYTIERILNIRRKANAKKL